MGLGLALTIIAGVVYMAIGGEKNSAVNLEELAIPGRTDSGKRAKKSKSDGAPKPKRSGSQGPSPQQQ